MERRRSARREVWTFRTEEEEEEEMTVKELIEALSVYKPDLKVTIAEGELVIRGSKIIVVHIPAERDK
jgi:hypothetical protein